LIYKLIRRGNQEKIDPDARAHAQAEETKNEQNFTHDIAHTFDLKQLLLKDEFTSINNPMGTLYFGVCNNAMNSTYAVYLIKNNGNIKSYGSADNMKLSRAGQRIILEYNGGDECDGWLGEKQFAHSSIWFSCDHHQTESIVHVVSDCYVIIEHKSPFLCPPITEECYLSYNGTFYDLRPLAQATGTHWEVEHNSTYALNICENLKGFSVSDTAVYKMDANANWPFLASAKSRQLEIKDANLQLTYMSLNECPYLNDTMYSTKIKFICGTNVGSPKFIEEKDCELIFEWSSHIVCPTAVQSIENFNKSLGIIQDSVTGIEINLSGIFDINGSNVMAYEERGTDQYIYVIRLGSPVENLSGECNKAHVCQSKVSGGFFRDIGSEGTMKIVMANSELEISFEGNLCGRFPQRKTRSIIHLSCDPLASQSDHPKFLYESQVCDYVFDWKLPQVCFHIVKNAMTTLATPIISTNSVYGRNNTATTDLSSYTTSAQEVTSRNDSNAESGHRFSHNQNYKSIPIALLIIILCIFLVLYAMCPNLRKKVILFVHKQAFRQRSAQNDSPVRDSEPIVKDSFSYCKLQDSAQSSAGRGEKKQKKTTPVEADSSMPSDDPFLPTERDDVRLI